jgi:hypothetical protein
MTSLTLFFVELVVLFINPHLRDRREIWLRRSLIWCGKEKDGRQNGVGDKHRDDRHDHRASR